MSQGPVASNLDLGFVCRSHYVEIVIAYLMDTLHAGRIKYEEGKEDNQKNWGMARTRDVVPRKC